MEASQEVGPRFLPDARQVSARQADHDPMPWG